ncbi:MAG: FmdB family zinc ribbon protein [bacterium]
MPTYEYECQRCGHTFEEFKSMTAAPRQRCPLCQGKVQKLISGGVGILFKGSGFYATDSRGGASRSNGNTSPQPEKITEAVDKVEKKDQQQSTTKKEPAKKSE